MRRHLRIYDDNDRETPQPAGPVALDVPEDATDDEIRRVIERDVANRSRPFTIRFNGGNINGPGWRLIYLDGEQQRAWRDDEDGRYSGSPAPSEFRRRPDDQRRHGSIVDYETGTQLNGCGYGLSLVRAEDHRAPARWIVAQFAPGSSGPIAELPVELSGEGALEIARQIVRAMVDSAVVCDAESWRISRAHVDGADIPF